MFKPMLRLGNFQFFSSEDSILKYDDFTQMLDELQKEDISEERKTEIFVQFKQERGLLHTKMDADGERMQKLEGINADLKATNQSLYNQLPPTYISPESKEIKKQTEREEKISKVNLNDLNNF